MRTQRAMGKQPECDIQISRGHGDKILDPLSLRIKGINHAFDGKVGWSTALPVLVQQNAGQKKLPDEDVIMGHLKVAKAVRARQSKREQ